MARRSSSASTQTGRTGGKAGRDAPADPRSRYRIFPEKCRGGFKALTRVEETDPETGKTVERIEDWGFATKDGFFMPGELYWETPERERRRLIFPLDWDLRELESVRASQRVGKRPQMPAGDPEKPEASRLFGDVWLLEQATKATGLDEDLAEAFEEDETLADDLCSRRPCSLPPAMAPCARCSTGTASAPCASTFL